MNICLLDKIKSSELFSKFRFYYFYLFCEITFYFSLKLLALKPISVVINTHQLSFTRYYLIHYTRRISGIFQQTYKLKKTSFSLFLNEAFLALVIQYSKFCSSIFLSTLWVVFSSNFIWGYWFGFSITYSC